MRAAVPAVAGQEWLVPEEAVYHCCPMGKKLSVPTPPQTLVAAKQARSSPRPLPVGLAMLSWATLPVTCTPGPMMSGFLRPADDGPRLEKPTMSLALSASASVLPQPSAPPKAWTFSAAPTVMIFFAVEGGRTVLAPEPPLPAAKTIVYSWFPGTEIQFGATQPVSGCASRTKRSYDCESTV